MVQLELRPSLGTRVGAPLFGVAVAVAAAVLFAADRGIVIAALWMVIVLQLTVSGWRDRLVVREDTLFVRDRFWREPVLLDHLTGAAYHWSWPNRRLPRTVLRLTDVDGATVDIALRRWARWRDLVALVTELSGLVPEGPPLVPVSARPF